MKPSSNDGPSAIAGWWLHNERMERGATIEEASLATRIEPALLQAIETGQLEKLPERGQALDIIWAYADFLKLEPGPLCAHFGKLLPGAAPELLAEPQTSGVKGSGTAMMAKFAMPKFATGQMIGAAFACFVAFGAFSYMVLPGTPATSGGSQLAEAIETDPIMTGSVDIPALKPPAETKVAMNGQAEPDPALSGLTELIAKTVTNAEPAKPAKPKAARVPVKVEQVERKVARVATTGGRLYGAENSNSRLLIQAKSRVWVRIEDNSGNVVLNQTLLSGDVFQVPNRAGLVLIARDGGALTYSLDGQQKGVIGTLGEILVGHPLDPDKIGQSS
ncbi:MAG: RodZ domain-containing protein [Pseudomonadota bacterium]